jgi:putative thioredoxin
MLDATGESFQREVIAASRERPVLVDFWAAWCAPCRALGPMLERLEQDTGRFRLVKIDADANQELAAQFGVRSIPTVVAFVDGRPVDQFVGALPEPQLRAFLDRVAPNPSEVARRKAAELRIAGDRAGAATSLRAALALEPANEEARLDLVALLLDEARTPGSEAVDEIRGLLARASASTRQTSRFRAAQTQLDSLAGASRLPPVAELERRVAADPGDLQARADLSRLLIAERRFEQALEQLLEIIDRDRLFDDDYARRTMLAVFELMGDRPDAVAAYRRRLASALNK